MRSAGLVLLCASAVSAGEKTELVARYEEGERNRVDVSVSIWDLAGSRWVLEEQYDETVVSLKDGRPYEIDRV